MSAFVQSKAIRRRAKEQLGLLSYGEVRITDEEARIGDHSTPPARTQSIAQEKEARYWDDSVISQLELYSNMAGISLQNTKTGEYFYQVDWESPSDPLNPRNWPFKKRVGTMLLLCLIAGTMMISASIESPVAPQAAEFFGVSAPLQSFSSTGSFLIGFGIGSLLTAPASEIWGRYRVYLAALGIGEGWLIGAALSPNITSFAIFRFLAGGFASASLTVAGGSMSDLWDTIDMTWAFPLFSVAAFGGSMIGPTLPSHFAEIESMSWRWAGWLIVILNGVCTLLVALRMEETFPPEILRIKAKQLRISTGNESFQTVKESEEEGLKSIIKKNFTRPFLLAVEPIVLFITLYTTIAATVSFTFLVGWPDIFEKTYGMRQGLSSLCFFGLFIGVASSVVLIPYVWRKTEQLRVQNGDDGSEKAIPQESRLMFAMFGAPFFPIGLLWMAWTDFPNISVWSPIIASIFVGFGFACIFISSYMYIIDSYQTYAASALTFSTIIRYLIAGFMTVAGIPMYENLGTHWAITVLGCIGVAVAPVPYILYFYGKTIRARSRYSVR